MELKKIASQEKRIVLTRQRYFYKSNKSVRCFFFRDNKLKTRGFAPLLTFLDQFAIIMKFFKLNIDEKKLFSRCVKCNSDKMKAVSRKVARRRLTHWRNSEDFKLYDFVQCQERGCGQVYWKGLSVRAAEKEYVGVKKGYEEREGIDGG